MDILKYIPYKHIYIDKKRINNKNVYNIFYKEQFSDILIKFLKSINIMVYNLDENDIYDFDKYLEEYLEEYLDNFENFCKSITMVVVNK